MNALAAALLALCSLQAPDRSTPEKAFESFNTFWDGVQGTGEKYMSIFEEIEALGDFLRADELKAARAKKREESARAREDYKTLSTTHVLVSTSAGADGSVIVEAQQKVKRRQKNFETKKVEEVEDTLPRRLVFVKTGAVWLVRDQYRACWSCKGTGNCGSCKGSGKFSDQECYGCKGKKACGTCSGEKLRKENLAEGKFGLVIPDPLPTYATDLSTPKAAAQAYADALLRKTVEMSARVKPILDDILARMRLYFAPEVMKAIADHYASESEAARRRFKDTTPRVESVDDKGAVIVTPTDDPKAKAQRLRVVFQQAGDKWLVSAEQHPCWGCEGGGTCTTCKGTGASEGSKCYACGGGKSCKRCKGTGWSGE